VDRHAGLERPARWTPITEIRGYTDLFGDFHAR
jgi:hypothetical protein